MSLTTSPVARCSLRCHFMRCALKRMDVEAAKDDLKNRTLPKLRDDFAQLIWLATLRDCNTGKYHYDGLAHIFSEPIAGMALAACHEDVFERIVLCPLELFVSQLERFILAASPDLQASLQTWEKAQSVHNNHTLSLQAASRRFVSLERQDCFDGSEVSAIIGS